MAETEVKNLYSGKIGKILTFRTLSQLEIDKLVERSRILIFEEGEKIISQGDIDQSFYAVIEGSVSVTSMEATGKDVYICTIGDGEIFGEAGIFMKVKRTASVTSSTRTVLIKIERAEMLSYIKEFPQAGNKILMVMIYGLLKKLREVNQELAYERKTDVDQADIDAIMNDLLK